MIILGVIGWVVAVALVGLLFVVFRTMRYWQRLTDEETAKWRASDGARRDAVESFRKANSRAENATGELALCQRHSIILVFSSDTVAAHRGGSEFFVTQPLGVEETGFHNAYQIKAVIVSPEGASDLFGGYGVLEGVALVTLSGRLLGPNLGVGDIIQVAKYGVFLDVSGPAPIPAAKDES